MKLLHMIFQSLKKQRTRAGLVILQLFIGFTALVFGLGIVEESKQRISDVTDFTPKQLLQAAVHSPLEKESGFNSQDPALLRNVQGFFQELQGMQGIEQIGTLYSQGVRIDEVAQISELYAKGTPEEQKGYVQMEFADTGFLSIYDLEVEEGRTLKPEDTQLSGHQAVPVLLAHQLGKYLPVGAEFTDLEGTTYRVAGILSSEFRFWPSYHQQVTSQGRDENLLVIVPLQETRNHSQTLLYRIGSLHLQGTGSGNQAELKQQIRQLAGKHELQAVTYNLEDKIIQYEDTHRMQIAFALAFAGILLLLASVGLLGVVFSTLVRRRKEFGIRYALGASWRQIAALVAGEVIVQVMVAAGLGILLVSSISIVFELRIGLYSWLLTVCAAMLVIVVSLGIPLGRLSKWEPVDLIRKGE